MIASLKHHILRVWAAAPLATLLLALALVATLLFGARTALFWSHRHERIAREQPVAAWMTPGYVAHSWHLPRTAVIEALALDPRAGPPRKSLAVLAADRNVPVTTLIDALETAIADHRAAHPPPRGDAQGVEPAPDVAPGAALGPASDAASGDPQGEARSPGDAPSEAPAPGAEGGVE